MDIINVHNVHNNLRYCEYNNVNQQSNYSRTAMYISRTSYEFNSAYELLYKISVEGLKFNSLDIDYSLAILINWL